MVSKITVFEPHFDGAQFGPASLPGTEAGVQSAAPDAEMPSESEASGRSVGRPLVLIAAIVAGLFLGLRAVRRRMASETEPVEIDEQEGNKRTVTP
jgi:hypothetical protein